MSSSELPSPSLDEIKTWDEHRIFEHFEHPTLHLKPGHVALLREQETGGAALILITEDVLLQPLYNLPSGSVTNIVNDIAKLEVTDSQQASTEDIDQSTLTLEDRIKVMEAEIELMKDRLRKEQTELREKVRLLIELQKEKYRALASDLASHKSKVMKIDREDNLRKIYNMVNSLPKVILDLHQDTIPRLFFIFPEDGHWRAPSIDSLFTKTFRLYFLCEHETIENDSTRKQFHLAYHDGYRVARPQEFVAKYGQYIRMIMPCLLLAVRLGGRLLECIPSIRNATTESSISTDRELDFCAQTEKFFKSVGGNLEATENKAMNYATDSPPSVPTQGGTPGPMERPDLRELQAYLEGLDNANRLGNLQRVLRREENGSKTVRWVCKNHASEWNTTNAIQVIRTAISSSFIDGHITFNDETWELMIWKMSTRSLHAFRNSVSHVLPDIPLRKISFLDCKNAHPEDIEALIEDVTTIEILKLYKIKNMQIKNILQKSLQIQQFDISGIKITEKEVSILAEILKTNTNLQNLILEYDDIGDKGTGMLAEALKMNTKLQLLNLCSNGIGDMGASTLAEALKMSTCLQSLDLTKNRIGNMGARALAEVLQMNASLQSLNLCGNHIGQIGASALAESLKMNTGLQNLNLSHNMIHDVGASALAEALHVNTTMLNLDLQCIFLREKGASALAEALKINTSLQNLNIYMNSIGEEGVSALAEALKINRSLQNLDLSNKDIGEKGARALAESLKMNTRLQNLNLKKNRIGENGASALAESLKMNTSLQHLNLEGNAIGDKGASALAEALKMNTSLLNLNLEENDIGERGASALAKTMKVNMCLTVVI